LPAEYIPDNAISRLGTGRVVLPPALSPDGTRLALATSVGLKVFAVRTGEEIWSAHTPLDAYPVVWSPDGSKIASTGLSWRVLLWDASTGHHLRTLNGHDDRINQIRWSPDGRRLASASGTFVSPEAEIIVWDLDTAVPLHVFSKRGARQNELAWSPDGARLVTWSLSDPRVLLWDTRTGEMLIEFNRPAKGGSLAWAPDGTILVDWSNWIDGVRIWDSHTGKKLREFDVKKPHFRGVEWSPVRSLLACGSGDRLVVYDGQTGGILTMRPTQGGSFSVAWAPDGESVISAGDEVLIHDLSDDHVIRHLEGHPRREFVLWALDGKSIFTFSRSHTLEAWDPATGRPLWSVPTQNAVTQLAWNPDGLLLAAGHEDVVDVWSPETGKSIQRLPLREVDGGAAVCSWSPDGSLLAVGTDRGLVLLWDPQGDVEAGRALLDADPRELAWSHDGSRLAIASHKGLWSWRPPSGPLRRLLDQEEYYLRTLEWSPDDGTLLTAGVVASDRKDALLLEWDSESGTLVRRWQVPSRERVKYIVRSPDGSRIATGGPHGVTIWNGTSKDSLLSLREHYEEEILYARTAAWSPDGGMLATGGLDRIIVWDTGTANRLITLRGHDGRMIRSLAWSPDGSVLSSGGMDGTVICWDVESLLSPAHSTKGVPSESQ
jgi:WD40 repeat protein